MRIFLRWVVNFVWDISVVKSGCKKSFRKRPLEWQLTAFMFSSCVCASSRESERRKLATSNWCKLFSKHVYHRDLWYKKLVSELKLQNIVHATDITWLVMAFEDDQRLFTPICIPFAFSLRVTRSIALSVIMSLRKKLTNQMPNRNFFE